jgi:hypothetical protein
MYQQEHGHNMPRLVGAAQTVSSATQEVITTFNSSGTLSTAASTSVIT